MGSPISCIFTTTGSSLPSPLRRLNRLRYLNFSENAFEEIPECVSGMTSLIELRQMAEAIVQLRAIYLSVDSDRY